MTHQYGDTQIIYTDASTSIVSYPVLYIILNPNHETEARGENQGENSMYPILSMPRKIDTYNKVNHTGGNTIQPFLSKWGLRNIRLGDIEVRRERH